ncbi:glycosyltransferase family 2 protein [Candidatus Dependentiae bacterium]|nr:glycosyltransferase family 2 protein [Candidatus Dependentiae bacterium]
MFNGISIIITNYNGFCLTEKLIESIYDCKFIKDYNYEIIICDDCSHNNDVDLLKKKFKDCIIIVNNKNQGNALSHINAVNYANYDILWFLDNDVIIKNINFSSIFNELSKNNVFAINPQILRPSMNLRNESISAYIFKNGRIQSENIGLHKNIEFKEKIKIAWATSCCMFVLKKKYFETGGFDSIYAPQYLEDNDLCYNAMKLGYDNIYLPDSAVYHYANTTMKKMYDENNLIHIDARNRFLFFWKNIDSLDLWIKHFFFILQIFIKYDKKNIRAFLAALKRIHKIRRLKRTQQNSDIKILDRFENNKLLDMLPENIKNIYKL